MGITRYQPEEMRKAAARLRMWREPDPEKRLQMFEEERKLAREAYEQVRANYEKTRRQIVEGFTLTTEPSLSIDFVSERYIAAQANIQLLRREINELKKRVQEVEHMTTETAPNSPSEITEWAEARATLLAEGVYIEKTAIPEKEAELEAALSEFNQSQMQEAKRKFQQMVEDIESANQQAVDQLLDALRLRWLIHHTLDSIQGYVTAYNVASELESAGNTLSVPSDTLELVAGYFDRFWKNPSKSLLDVIEAMFESRTGIKRSNGNV